MTTARLTKAKLARTMEVVTDAGLVVAGVKVNTDGSFTVLTVVDKNDEPSQPKGPEQW